MSFIKQFESFRDLKLFSKVKQLTELRLPEFKGDQAQMIPFNIENPKLPDNLKRWEPLVKECLKYSTVKSGIAFITIDERILETGKSHRRGGAHIDGNYTINEEWGTSSGSWQQSRDPLEEWKTELPEEVVKVINDYKYILDDDQCEVTVDDNSVKVKTSKSGSSFNKGSQYLEFKDRVKEDLPDYEMKVIEPNEYDDDEDDDDYPDDEEDREPSYNHAIIYFKRREEKPTKKSAKKKRRYISENQLSKGGMLIVSSEEYCQAWEGVVYGEPGEKGDCEHLREQFGNMNTFKLKKNNLYWTNSSCIHESLVADKELPRQLLRITLPNDAPHLY